MNLRPRFFLINLFIISSAFLATLAVFFYVADKTVRSFGLNLAEKQLLYDKTRAAQYLTREIAISRQIAKSKNIIYWARNQNDPQAEKDGLEQMESYRSMFIDGNYFVAFRSSGKYFYNNVTRKYDGKQYQYTLSPDKQHDSWFYGIISENKDFHINVNPDVYLGVTMLWVDVLIKDNDEILGVMGTGLDLNGFIDKFVDAPDTGVSSVFVDHNGAVQVYFDKNYIDFSGISKSEGQHKLIQEMFAVTADQDFVVDAMSRLPKMPDDQVLSHIVRFAGKKYLAGISYIPELDWYEIAFFDPEKLINRKDLYGLPIAFVVTLLLSMLLYNLSITRFVLNPLQKLEKAIARMHKGDFRNNETLDPSGGDVGRILSHFQEMSQSVQEMTEVLERKVAERTEALDRLVKIDPMTELLNRRGMEDVQGKELSRAARMGRRVGLLWIDIDRFKSVNDSFGHGVGDTVIIAVAKVIQESVRQYDHVARWGGDEFIVLLPECTEETLVVTSERILLHLQNKDIKAAEKTLTVHVSVGGYLAESGETLDDMLNKADKALYQAKANGKGCMRLFAELGG
jgi:diguanylate cyclase (GGDEF)-like protein